MFLLHVLCVGVCFDCWVDLLYARAVVVVSAIALGLLPSCCFNDCSPAVCARARL